MPKDGRYLYSNDPAVRLDIERAIYLTRAGKHNEAVQIYQLHRNRDDFGEDADSSLMLMLVDGLISYYRDRDLSGATDRLYRAQALGRAVNRSRTLSLIDVWLSHCYFNSGKYGLMFNALDEAIANGALEFDQAAARLLLTVADAHALAGDFGNGRFYYDAARAAAVSLGDTLSISAAAHNRSTLAISHLRFTAATGHVTSSSAQSYLRELLSAASLESYLDQSNVLYPIQVWSARNDLLSGRYSTALSTFETVLADPAEQDSVFKTSLLADAAYCHHQLSNSGRARDFIDLCLAGGVDALPTDDQAVAYSFAAEVLSADGRSTLKAECQERMRTARDAFIGEIASLNDQLAQFRSRVPTQGDQV